MIEINAQTKQVLACILHAKQATDKYFNAALQAYNATKTEGDYNAYRTALSDSCTIIDLMVSIAKALNAHQDNFYTLIDTDLL